MTHVCGRFDNAPAHIIIESTKYSTHHVGGHPSREVDDEIEDRKEERREAAELAREAKAEARSLELTRKAEARKEMAERDRGLREARSQENRKLIPNKKKAPDGTWLNTNPRKRNKKVVHRINPLFEREDTHPQAPAGYVALQGLAADLTIPCLIRAIGLGLIPAVKLSRKWFVDPIAVKAYCDGTIDRRKVAARNSLRKARFIRNGHYDNAT